MSIVTNENTFRVLCTRCTVLNTDTGVQILHLPKYRLVSSSPPRQSAPRARHDDLQYGVLVSPNTLQNNCPNQHEVSDPCVGPHSSKCLRHPLLAVLQCIPLFHVEHETCDADQRTKRDKATLLPEKQRSMRKVRWRGSSATPFRLVNKSVHPIIVLGLSLNTHKVVARHGSVRISSIEMRTCCFPSDGYATAPGTAPVLPTGVCKARYSSSHCAIGSYPRMENNTF